MTHHLSARSLIVQRLSAINGGDFILASTDAGRAKQVESLANELKVDAALIIKRRLSGSETEIVGVNAHVDGRVVVIYDDMVRTGGSLIQAAQAYLDAGAREIYAACTHGIFPKGSWDRIQNSKLFKKVIATDSHPMANTLAKHGLEVLHTAPIFSNALRMAAS